MYETMAKECTERFHQRGVQQKLAHALVTFDRNSPEAEWPKRGRPAIRQRIFELHAGVGCFRIRAFVLTAHKDTAGTIDVAEYVSYRSLASTPKVTSLTSAAMTSSRISQRPILHVRPSEPDAKADCRRMAEICRVIIQVMLQSPMKTCCSKLSIDPDGDYSSTDDKHHSMVS